MQVKVADIAADRAFGHAVRFPHKTVFGVLLGTNDETSWEVKNAVPMAHNSFLGTATQVGLTMISQYCKRYNSEHTADLKILGLYAFDAEDVVTSESEVINVSVRQAAEAICMKQSQCLYLQGNLGTMGFKSCILKKDSMRIQKPTDVELDSTTLVRKTIESCGYEQYYDVEEFLIDPTFVPVMDSS